MIVRFLTPIAVEKSPPVMLLAAESGSYVRIPS
jgi:hypothetical protein